MEECVDTHWFSFKRKGLKRASANIARASVAALMRAGLIGPAASQPQKAEAGTMNWERGSTVHKTSGDPFTSVAVGNDGTVFAVNGTGPASVLTPAAALKVDNRMFRSSDG